jgi:DNA adenine methylase
VLALMQYLGGKTRIAKQLATLINSVREPGQWVWDPFCGGLSMSVALSEKGPVWSTDINPALISLYKAVQSGWQPPSSVSKEEYESAKALPDSNPLKAFCGFGCSFGGKWFGGYAHDVKGTRNRDGVPSNYALSAKRRISAELDSCSAFACLDFSSVEPQPTEAIIYADPPYEGTTGYKGAPAFDSELFFKQALRWAAFTHVFISEYACPVGLCVWQGTSTTTVRTDKSRKQVATERLFYIPKGTR